jgi:hypothetical protein
MGNILGWIYGTTPTQKCVYQIPDFSISVSFGIGNWLKSFGKTSRMKSHDNKSIMDGKSTKRKFCEFGESLGR